MNDHFDLMKKNNNRLWRMLHAACLITGLGVSSLLAGESSLQKGFVIPPDSAKPHTWWHWMNGYVSAEGITKDLEAMKRVEIDAPIVIRLDGTNAEEGRLLRFAVPHKRLFVQSFAVLLGLFALELVAHLSRPAPRTAGRGGHQVLDPLFRPGVLRRDLAVAPPFPGPDHLPAGQCHPP